MHGHLWSATPKTHVPHSFILMQAFKNLFSKKFRFYMILILHFFFFLGFK